MLLIGLFPQHANRNTMADENKFYITVYVLLVPLDPTTYI